MWEDGVLTSFFFFCSSLQLASPNHQKFLKIIFYIEGHRVYTLAFKMLISSGYKTIQATLENTGKIWR